MLKTCDKEGCCPVEQIRGEMGQGDYFDVIVNNRTGYPGSVLDPEKYGIPIYDKSTQRRIDIHGHDGSVISEPDPTDTRAFEILEGTRPEHYVEMNDAMKDSFRICCKTCGKATPWGAKDIPGMPDAGADWTRNKWNSAQG